MIRHACILTAGLTAVLATTSGCTLDVAGPDLGGLYSRAAREHDATRNPVIVIPGILGSKLVDKPSGTLVWGAFAGDFADPRKPSGARLTAVPMREGVPLRDLGDDVRPDGALDRLRVNLFGLPIELNAYVHILGVLGVGGYRDEGLGLAGAVDYGDDHYTCFQFAYDWRLDNVANARRLHRFIRAKQAYVRAETQKRSGVDPGDMKFDIVAHSMGGLVTRYMLRYGDADLPDRGPVPEPTWAGADLVERVILVGTPNAGSAEAVVQLVEGIEFAPFLPTYSPAVLGTMPSVYQLLPRARHGAVVDTNGDPLDVFDIATWERMRWGLADPKQDGELRKLLPDVSDAAARRRIALDHLRKCLDRARRFDEALDSPADSIPGVRLYLVAGDATKTLAVVSVDAAGRVRPLEHGPGDGTVLRTSAHMDERVGGEWQRTIRTPVPWSGTYFLFTDHLGLTRDPMFADNILYVLLEMP